MPLMEETKLNLLKGRMYTTQFRIEQTNIYLNKYLSSEFSSFSYICVKGRLNQFNICFSAKKKIKVKLNESYNFLYKTALRFLTSVARLITATYIGHPCQILSFAITWHTYGPVDLGCRIHRLHLYRVSLLERVPWICFKQSDSEATVKLELWGIRSTSSLPLLQGSHWPRVVAPDWVK